MKKNINEVSIEDLLKALEGEDLSPSTMEYQFDNPVLSFIQAFNLVSGPHRVPARLLYRLYKVWSLDTQTKQNGFSMTMGQFVEKSGEVKSFFHISTGVMELAKKIQDITKKRKKPRHSSKAWHIHFEKFLTDTSLEPGTIFIEADILFYVYNRWCDDTRKRNRLSYYSFCSICKMNFDYKNKQFSDLLWYGVNDKVKDLIKKEEVERWRSGRERNGKKRVYVKKAIYYKEKK